MNEKFMTISNSFHDDLKTAKEMVYTPCNFDFKNLKWNTESLEYGACSFELGDKKIMYRVSKITPTKNGQFVTIWKRNHKGITEPFDINDEIDFVIITARSGNKLGQIIFQKSVTISACKSPEEIAQKVHQLEHKYFPEVISGLLNSKF